MGRTLLIQSLILATSIIVAYNAHESKKVYRLGVGMADITGPAADVIMVGYGQFDQQTEGIHTRQYSRCFIIQDGKSRVIFISIDSCMTSQIVFMQVIKKLKKEYGDLYTEKNVCISSTHTHSTPGGFLQYFLYTIPNKGFVRESYDSMVEGILKSIERAHNSMKPGHLFLNKGNLYGANINRSPTSYLENPAEERAQYDSNVDEEMVLLTLTDLKGNPFGMINWFPVHPTSLNFTNRLISSDNKGYAALLFERKMNEKAKIVQSPFVAAFAQSNSGDVSPNTKGPICIDTGLPCDLHTSTCDGQVTTCQAALGNGFGAGTTDGVGDSSFTQGGKSSSFMWNFLRMLMTRGNHQIEDCQKPKPVLIPTGAMGFPYAWQPSILPIQILRVGQLAIVAVPAEFTTMSGRRLRKAVKKVQRYEGASTLFGPYTLQAYIQEFEKLAKSLCTGEKLPEGPAPPDMQQQLISLASGLGRDVPFKGKNFGDVIENSKSSYRRGETVSVTFASGNPRNNPMLEGTFLTVERLDPKSGKWTVVAKDSDPETKFLWKRESDGTGKATAVWDIPENVTRGTYRIQHFGYSKQETVASYKGTSRPFKIS